MTLVAPHRLRTPSEPIGPHPDTSFYVVVSSGVTSSGLTQDATVGEDVLSGGTAISNTVSSGGLVIVEGGGVTRSDTVLSGGIEQLYSGAVASSLTVSAGGVISGPGVVASGTIEGYGVGFKVQSAAGLPLFGNVAVQAGGLVSSVEVDLFGIINVDAGGTAEAVTLVNGVVTVADSGTLSGVTVSSGGLIVAEGGLTQGATVLTYGEMDVGFTSSGEVASAVGVQVGFGAKLEVGSGGVVSTLTVHNSGVAEVQSGGGVAHGLVAGGVLSFGTEAQGLAVTVSSGGLLEVGHAAAVSGVTLQSGTLAIASYGEVLGITAASGTTISGTLVIADGGAIGFGGRREVAAKIVGGGIVYEEGGGTMVLDGALSGYTGEIAIGGGAVELNATGAIGAHDVWFIGSSGTDTLQIDVADQPASGGTFAPLISAWTDSDERIDLAGRAFVSGSATARLNGDVLTVKDGAYIAKFMLTGDHASRYVVASDGHGGILVRAAAVVTLRDAAAAFDGAQSAAVQGSTPAGLPDRHDSFAALPAERRFAER